MILKLIELWHGRLGRYVPLFLCAALILFLSGSEASMAKSSRYLRPLLEFLFPTADEAVLSFYIFYIRKFAHIAEYMILAFFASRALSRSSKTILRNWWPGFSLLFVGFVAATDETIQSFNPLRTGAISDVFIDLTGGLIGVTVYLLLAKAISYVLAPQAEIKLHKRPDNSQG